MVCYTDITALCSKPIITQSACGHFYAFACFLALRVDIEMLNLEGYIVCCTKFAHKVLVGIAFVTTQMEIAVQGGEGQLQFVHHQSQSDGIGSPTQGTKQTFAAPERSASFKKWVDLKRELHRDRGKILRRRLIRNGALESESFDLLTYGVEHFGTGFAESFGGCFAVDGVDVDSFGTYAR